MNKKEKMQKIANKNWANPEYREKQLKERKTRKNNIPFRQKMQKIASNQTQEMREQKSKKQKENFKNPERRKQHMQMIEDTQEQRKQKMRDNWNNTSFVYRVMKKRLKDTNKALDVIEDRFGYEQRIECEKKVYKK